MCLQFCAGNFISNLLTVRLRHDADGDIRKIVASVTDDSSERCHFVRIDNHFANVALHRIRNVRTRWAAHSHGGG